METCEYLFRVFVAILFGICVFSCSCDAASVCPARAVRTVTLEGVKCVCKNPFFGEKCQFSGAHWEMDATWNGVHEVKLVIKSEVNMESFHLFARKVAYNVTNFPTYGKWKGVAQSRENGEDVNMQGREEEQPLDPAYNAATAVAFLALNQAYTWEIRVIMKDDTNKSATIFIDPPILRATAQPSKINSTNGTSEDDKCRFYECPEKAFGFFLNFFEDFNSPSLKKGVVVGIVIGILGTVTVGALIYVLIRHIFPRCSKKQTQLNPRPHSNPSCVIEIPDIEMVPRASNNNVNGESKALKVQACSVPLPETDTEHATSRSMSDCRFGRWIVEFWNRSFQIWASIWMGLLLRED